MENATKLTKWRGLAQFRITQGHWNGTIWHQNDTQLSVTLSQ